jgi:hypothetical protein
LNKTDSPSASITFTACENISRLSSQPAGQLLISNIKTPSAIKDSGEFYVEIYKGATAEPNALVARTSKGIKLIAGLLVEGKLSDFSISAKDSRVQATSGHRIKFTTENQVGENGAIQIKMPVQLTLPAVGT